MGLRFHDIVRLSSFAIALKKAPRARFEIGFLELRLFETGHLSKLGCVIEDLHEVPCPLMPDQVGFAFIFESFEEAHAHD